jgi:SAM-dependent methyltransferase
MTTRESTPSGPGINYERLYAHRFRNVSPASRQDAWNEIAPFIYDWMGRPERVLDPAAGFGEFVNAIAAPERWVIDMVEYDAARYAPGTKVVIGDARTVSLPEAHFDGVFMSNFLEHLTAQEEIGSVLNRIRRAMRPGGRIAVLGPNFKFCAREYFDCADHTVPLTHISVEEHLYAAGFEIRRNVPRFLPYTFAGRLPAAPVLVRAYLRVQPAWRVLGKQFLVIGENSGA